MSLTRPNLLSTLMFSFSMSDTSNFTGDSTELSIALFSIFSVTFLFSRTMMLLLMVSLAMVSWRGAVELPFSRTSYWAMFPRVYTRTDSMV